MTSIGKANRSRLCEIYWLCQCFFLAMLYSSLAVCVMVESEKKVLWCRQSWPSHIIYLFFAFNYDAQPLLCCSTWLKNIDKANRSCIGETCWLCQCLLHLLTLFGHRLHLFSVSLTAKCSNRQQKGDQSTFVKDLLLCGNTCHHIFNKLLIRLS